MHFQKTDHSYDIRQDSDSATCELQLELSIIIVIHDRYETRYAKAAIEIKYLKTITKLLLQTQVEYLEITYHFKFNVVPRQQ